MIEVTRLNGNRMILNSDLIKIAEASPDTMLTLIHGEKLIVRETCAEIMDKVLAYRATLLATVAMQTTPPQCLHRLVALGSLPHESSMDAGDRDSPTTGVGGKLQLCLAGDDRSAGKSSEESPKAEQG
jgi:flagellar protein FlbD